MRPGHDRPPVLTTPSAPRTTATTHRPHLRLRPCLTIFFRPRLSPRHAHPSTPALHNLEGPLTPNRRPFLLTGPRLLRRPTSVTHPAESVSFWPGPALLNLMSALISWKNFFMAAAARRRGPQGGGRRARVDEEQAANHRKENIAATEVPPGSRDNRLAATRGRGAIFLSADAVAGATGLPPSGPRQPPGELKRASRHLAA